ncbi:MAG: hypothetical protein ACOY3Y_15385 [Acidobacteriota bacterium]
MTCAAKLLIVAAALFVVAANMAAQSRDCPATLAAWAMDPRMPKGCRCPCTTCAPQCGSFSSGTYFGSPNSFAAQMAGSLIGGMLAAAFAPIEFDSSDYEAQLAAADAERKRLEAENAKFFAEWRAFQERAIREGWTARGRESDAGKGLLERMQGTQAEAGTAPPAPTAVAGLEGFKWEPRQSSALTFAPLSSATFDTSGLAHWQRALCAAYFSQLALSAVEDDPNRVRRLGEYADQAAAGQPVEEPCSFPRIAALPEPGRPEPANDPAGPTLAEVTEILAQVRTRADELRGLDVELRRALRERDDAEAVRGAAEDAVMQAEAARATAAGDAALLAETDRRVGEALRQREEAERRMRELAQQVDEIEESREAIRRELLALQERLQRGTEKG